MSYTSHFFDSPSKLIYIFLKSHDGYGFLEDEGTQYQRTSKIDFSSTDIVLSDQWDDIDLEFTKPRIVISNTHDSYEATGYHTKGRRLLSKSAVIKIYDRAESGLRSVEELKKAILLLFLTKGGSFFMCETHTRDLGVKQYGDDKLVGLLSIQLTEVN